MSRIFATLSILVMLLLSANIVIGSLGGDYNGVSQQYRQQYGQFLAARHRDDAEAVIAHHQQQVDQAFAQLKPMQDYARTHILFGVLVCLVTVLVNSIAVTYFIGTSRWCKEVVDTYHLDQAFVDRSNGLKRSSFPFALVGVFTALAIVACGAAADPATLRPDTQAWVMPHYVLALGGTAVIGFVLFRQATSIGRNHALIGEILKEVHRVREASACQTDR